jgi:hypothetical protein
MATLRHSPPMCEIVERVRALQRAFGSTQAMDAVLACGSAAIPALRQALLNGAPRSIAEPRRALVDALAALAAQPVLREYLDLYGSRRLPPADPVSAFAEEIVASIAAERLTDCPEARRVLMAILRQQCLLGAIYQLALWNEQAAIPLFPRCLEDDICRDAALNALRQFGTAARSALQATALDAGRGTESARRRRRAALRLLGEQAPLSAAEWASVGPLCRDDDAEIAARACGLGWFPAPDAERTGLVARLRELLPRLDWILRDQIATVLVPNNAASMVDPSKGGR